MKNRYIVLLGAFLLLLLPSGLLKAQGPYMDDQQLLAMAFALAAQDPEMKEELEAFMALPEEEREKVLSKTANVVGAIALNYQIDQRLSEQAKQELLIRFKTEGVPLFSIVGNGLINRQYPKNEAIELNVYGTITENEPINLTAEVDGSNQEALNRKLEKYNTTAAKLNASANELLQSMFTGATIDAIKADEAALYLAFYDAFMAKLVEGSDGGSEEEEVNAIASNWNNMFSDAEELNEDIEIINCLYFVNPDGELVGVNKQSYDKLTLSYSAAVPAGTVAAFELDGQLYKYMQGSYYKKVEDEFIKADFSSCQTSEASLIVHSPINDSECNVKKIVKGNFTVGGALDNGITLTDIQTVWQPNTKDGLPEIAYIDLLKKGQLIIDPESYGAMFSIQIGGQERYFYREFNNNEFTDRYYVWEEGCGWFETTLVDSEKLKEYPEFMTLMDVWTAIKNDPVHASLAGLGFMPIFGVVFDGVDALVYIYEGDYFNAALSSAAIITSGVVLGVRAVVKVAKASKTVTQTIKFTDEFASTMTSIFKTAEESSTLNPEKLLELQNKVVELTGRSDEAMAGISALAKDMDEVKFVLAADKIHALESSADFFNDLKDPVFQDFIRIFGQEGVEAWGKFGKSPLRTNTKYLEAMTDFPPAWKIETNGGVTKILNGNGDELAELTEDLIKAKGGSKGSWNELLNKPPVKNHKYQVERYLYETDELGRVKKVKGELEYIERGRNEYQQGLSVGLKDGVKGQDDGGHLIANILNGPGEQINYMPQTANLNRGRWQSMESAWAEALQRGEKVEIEIIPMFNGSSKRPYKFIVRENVGGKQNVLDFPNN